MSTTAYQRIGDIFIITNRESLDLRDNLPIGNYTVKASQKYGLYLQPVELFQLPKKLYGDITSCADRMLNTFLDRPAATGIMLAGEKGSGKSLLAKTLSIEGAKRDIITVIINEPFHGDDFNTFIQSITQPAIILFDEFEKVYDKDQQESILTLLDGVYPTKKLFVITCNDKWKVDMNMRNRPGRIFYMLNYEGLTESFIREYCEDNLKDKQYIDRICRLVRFFDKFNFDMLKALVEEMNRYNESPEESLKILNIKPEYSSAINYDIKIYIDNKPVDESDSWTKEVLTNVVYNSFYIEHTPYDKEKKEWLNDKEIVFGLDPSCIVEMTERGEIIYIPKDYPKYKVVLSKKTPEKGYHYLDV